MKLNLNNYCKYSRNKVENRSVKNIELVIPVLDYGILWPEIELRAGKRGGEYCPSLRCYKLAFNGAKCLD
jgi:hypothetical protein